MNSGYGFFFSTIAKKNRMLNWSFRQILDQITISFTFDFDEWMEHF